MNARYPLDPVSRLISDGFLRIPLDAETHRLVAATFEAAFPFIRATLPQKMSCRLAEDCGYRPRGIEYSQSPDRPDSIESFTACARLPLAETHLASEVAYRLYERMIAVVGALGGRSWNRWRSTSPSHSAGRGSAPRYAVPSIAGR